MIGHVDVVADAAEFIASEKLGPDALDPRFGLPAFQAAVAGIKRDIKSVLMDQEIVAGIANIYADEILFQARVDPTTRIGDLSPARLKHFFTVMRKVLEAAVRRRAGSEEFTDRMPRGSLLPERKKGGRCPRCHLGLSVSKIGGRTSYLLSALPRRIATAAPVVARTAKRHSSRMKRLRDRTLPPKRPPCVIDMDQAARPWRHLQLWNLPMPSRSPRSSASRGTNISSDAIVGNRNARGRTAMEAHVNVQKCPEVPAEERTSHEIVKQILKLRWIGRKHDADQLLAAFGRPGPRDSVRWSVRRDQLSGEPT